MDWMAQHEEARGHMAFTVTTTHIGSNGGPKTDIRAWTHHELHQPLGSGPEHVPSCHRMNGCRYYLTSCRLPSIPPGTLYQRLDTLQVNLTTHVRRIVYGLRRTRAPCHSTANPGALMCSYMRFLHLGPKGRPLPPPDVAPQKSSYRHKMQLQTVPYSCRRYLTVADGTLQLQTVPYSCRRYLTVDNRVTAHQDGKSTEACHCNCKTVSRTSRHRV
jgi:hypothetical protein